MDNITSHTIASAPRDSAQCHVGQRRVVPGPKSKAIFDCEAEAMAPGLQSIALYSQIVVDHTKGCTIVDVHGNEYLDFIPRIPIPTAPPTHPPSLNLLTHQLALATLS